MGNSNGISVDPVRAFESLQQFHGSEMARLAGDIAAKNAFIEQLQKEILDLKDKIVTLENTKTADVG